jgi:hypothetical protein
MADVAATGGGTPRAHRGNGVATGDTDNAPSATSAPSAPRTLPAPAPGPQIVRPAGARVRTRGSKGDVAGQKQRARDRRARAEPAPASAPAPRNVAGDIREAHADAANMLGIPELELSAAEAARVAGAFERTQALTGFTASGPMWDWLFVGYVLACVYLRRAFDILARRRAEASTSTSPPASTSATASTSPLSAPIAAPIAATPRTSPEPFAPVGPLKPAAPGNGAPAPAMTQESIAFALARGAETVAGFEKREAGLPVSSIDERLSGI